MGFKEGCRCQQQKKERNISGRDVVIRIRASYFSPIESKRGPPAGVVERGKLLSSLFRRREA